MADRAGGSIEVGGAMTLNAGPVTFAPYRTAEEASPFDAPAIHLPSSPVGEQRRRALAAMGCTFVDVGPEIAQLAGESGHEGASSPAPRLPGTPVDRRLRASLSKLGATHADGELEINEQEMVALARVDESGAAQPFALPMSHAVRVVFRAGPKVTDETLAAELARVATRLLRSLIPVLHELPPFVRDRVRTMVCDAVRSGERHPIDDSADVFVDVRGYFWSLARLQEVSARGGPAIPRLGLRRSTGTRPRRSSISPTRRLRRCGACLRSKT